MGKIKFAGLEINRVSIIELLFNKTMILAYILLCFGLFGIYEIINERYFLLTANAFDAGLNPGSAEVANAMKEAIFGHGGEVHRESPWTLYISNYMYMIYTGSGIIFLVALAELFNVKIIEKTAAGFLTLGLCFVFGGLYTIIFDLNVLHMHWMFITPNVGAGMWLMLPLYVVYISFVLFEIYLIVNKNFTMVKKMALVIIILGISIDIAEYYIQAKLFNMNTARHLWTTYPALPLYFIVTSFLAACGVMMMYSYLTLKNKLKAEFNDLISLLIKVSVVSLIAVASYEALAFLFIDKKWASVILFSGFHYEFYIYMFLAIILPFAILAYEFTFHETNKVLVMLASLSIIVGTFIGRFIFVYGGNAYPMSDRFDTGFQKYSEYEVAKDFIFFFPPLIEILIVVGSVGVVIAAYKVFDVLLSVSEVREH